MRRCESASVIEAIQRYGLATDAQNTTETPKIELLSALRRHWFAALAPVLALVAISLVLGLERPPRYTATANLSVGHVFVNNPAGIPTLVEATRSLASVYSRAINAGAVREDTARRLGRRSFQVSGRLSATPIPETPLIKVSAASDSEREALALANAGSLALAGYVNRQLRRDGELAALGKQYRQAALRYRQRLDAQERLDRRYEANRTAANRAARARARAATDGALLDRNAVSESYHLASQGDSASPAIQVFARATSTSSDRSSAMQVLVFVGLIGGLAAGTALALLRRQRKTRPRSVG
jgi:capsular polysaccharide biosynthesis protein